MMTLRCKKCSQILKAPEGQGGRKARCSHCGNKFLLPSGRASKHSTPTVVAKDGTRSITPPLSAQASVVVPAVRRAGVVAAGRDPASAVRASASRRPTPTLEFADRSGSAVATLADPVEKRVDNLELLPEEQESRRRSDRAESSPENWFPFPAVFSRRPDRDLETEAQIRAISFWERVVGIFMILGGILTLALGSTVLAKAASLGGGVLLGLGGMTAVLSLGLMVVGAGLYAAGHFLWNYHDWARWVVAAIAGLQGLNLVWYLARMGMLASRLGVGVSAATGVVPLAIAGLMLAWYGFKTFALLQSPAVAVCTEEYREIVRSTPGEVPAWYASGYFWLPCLWIVAQGGLLFGGLALIAAR